MYKFFKELKDLKDVVDVELIRRAEKRFAGVEEIVFGWVVQNTESNKVLWGVTDICKVNDTVNQYGVTCINEGKIMVYVDIQQMAYYVPELTGHILTWDTTSAVLGFSNAKVIGRAYSTISLVAKINRMINEGRVREVTAMKPEVILITPEAAATSDYIEQVNKARRENGIIVIGPGVEEEKAKSVGYYAESERMVEVSKVVRCN